MDSKTGRAENTVGLNSNSSAKQIDIRKFRDEDAEFCYQIRVHAFTNFFKQEIGEEAVAAGINAYQPEDYKRMAQDMESFIVKVDNQPAGFFIIQQLESQTAELVLIYLENRYISLGLGRYCCRYLESWIADHWLGVRKIYVETVIPGYNAAFYQKMGYQEIATVLCRFPDMSIVAKRLEKTLLN